jgi:hypothetical protein
MTRGRKILGFLLSSCLSILILSVGLQFENKNMLFISLISCSWVFYVVFSILKPTEYIELHSLDDEIREGDYVTHFKFVDDNTLNYVYKVLHLEATSTETGEKFVVYQAMYDDKKIYIRPKEEFFSEVDKEKYPNTFQTFRFEKITDKWLMKKIRKLI